MRVITQLSFFIIHVKYSKVSNTFTSDQNSIFRTYPLTSSSMFCKELNKIYTEENDESCKNTEQKREATDSFPLSQNLIKIEKTKDIITLSVKSDTFSNNIHF